MFLFCYTLFEENCYIYREYPTMSKDIRKIVRKELLENEMVYKIHGGKPKSISDDVLEDFFVIKMDDKYNQYKELIATELTIQQANELAKKMGLEFKPDRNSIYKGYFVDSEKNAYFYGPIEILFYDIPVK